MTYNYKSSDSVSSTFAPLILSISGSIMGVPPDIG